MLTISRNKIFKKKDLIKILKISDPFLIIEGLKNIKKNKFGYGFKNLKRNEWFYKCHFLGDPVMPGVLQVEAMLQTIVSILYISDNKINQKYLIIKSDTNFYRKVSGSGKFLVKSKIISKKNGAVHASAISYFNKKKVSDGNFKLFNPVIFKVNKKNNK